MEEGNPIDHLQQSGQTQLPSLFVFDKILVILEDINKKLESLVHLEVDVDGIKTSLQYMESILSQSGKMYDVQEDDNIEMKIKGKRSVTLNKDDEVQYYSAKKRFRHTPVHNEDTNIILELSDDDCNIATPHVQSAKLFQRNHIPGSGIPPNLPGSGIPTNLPRSTEKGKSMLKPSPMVKKKETIRENQYKSTSRKTSMIGRQSSFLPNNVLAPPKLAIHGQVFTTRKASRMTPAKVQSNPQKLLVSGSNRQLKPTNTTTQKGKIFNLNAKTSEYLTTIQLQMNTYVFEPDMDPNEVIITIGDTSATRKDLDCLDSGKKKIDDKIIKLFALKCTWNQEIITLKTYWCLPPTFAEDIFQGSTIEELIDQYANKYMQPYPDLKFIYVPMKEFGGHWYLMVVCPQQKIIYHLDSCLPPDRVKPRKEIIKEVGGTLAQMMSYIYVGDGNFENCCNWSGWEVVQTQGLPKCKEIDSSGVWVLGWLDMEYAFNPNLPEDQSEKKILIETLIKLVLGDCNEMKNIIETKVVDHWNTISNDF